MIKIEDKKVLLISPPYHTLFERSANFSPLGLFYIASVLRKNGFETRIYDANLSKKNVLIIKRTDPSDLLATYRKNLSDSNFYIWKNIKKIIKKFYPDIIGISMPTCSYNSALKVAEIAKNVNENITVIVGGPHPTALPKEVITEPHIDVAIRGEGEHTMLELLKNKNKLKKINGITYKRKNRVFHNPSCKLQKNLDLLPFPAKDLLINRKDASPIIMGMIMGSRGCPYRCNFCGSHMMWGRRIRFRSPQNVIDEIEYVRNVFGIRSFTFADDTFTFNKKWCIEICKLIRKRKLDITWVCNTRLDTLDEEILREMRLAGSDKISVGVESGSQEILNAMGRNITLEEMKKGIKKIRKFEFLLHITAMVGYPGETNKTINATKKFIKKINPDTFFIFIATPYPGTKLYEIAEKENLLLHKNWSEYTTLSPIIKLNTMNNKTLISYYNELLNYQYEKWGEFYKRRVLNLGNTIKKIKESTKSPRCFITDIKEFFKISIGL